MNTPDLLIICASAFAAVFVLLGFLALIMRVITAVFPAKDIGSDAVVMAALAGVMQTVYPGTKITRVEEQK
jgi:hypothetical protein